MIEPLDRVAAMGELLKCVTASDLDAVLKKYPGVLSDDFERYLNFCAAQASYDVRQTITEIINVLATCRRESTEAAIAARECRRSTRDLVVQLIEAGSDAALVEELISANPDSIGNDAERLLQDMVPECTAYSIDQIDAVLALIRRCRSLGIKDAVSAYEHDLAEIQAVEKLLEQFIFTSDDEDAAAIVREHPVLLGSTCLHLFEQLLIKGRKSELGLERGSSTVQIRRRRAMLEQIRESSASSPRD